MNFTESLPSYYFPTYDHQHLFIIISQYSGYLAFVFELFLLNRLLVSQSQILS